MAISQGDIVPIRGFPSGQATHTPSEDDAQWANYLPDELLLQVLSYIEPRRRESQITLAKFCLVNRQWYDLAIGPLYEAPYLSGKTYDLFVRTVCPSVLAHIKRSELAGLVKILDLSHIVHHGNKATTARLLNRTKPSLEVFVAPQASFAINCWASLSKCTKLRVLNLSLVSESISYQSLNQTIRQLPDLTRLCLPRCSSNYETVGYSATMTWPPRLQHLQLSGKVRGLFLSNLLAQPETFPQSMHSLAISYCPNLVKSDVRKLLVNISGALTKVELRDLPHVKQGELNEALDWLPNLKVLTIAVDYIDTNFGNMPKNFNPLHWAESKPLEVLYLLSSGQRESNPDDNFLPEDLFTLIDERYLGRLRKLAVATSTGWWSKDDGAEVEAIAGELERLDAENWKHKRWHYKDFTAQKYGGMSWETWATTPTGRSMIPQTRRIVDS